MFNLLMPVRQGDLPAGSRNLASVVFQECFVAGLSPGYVSIAAKPLLKLIWRPERWRNGRASSPCPCMPFAANECPEPKSGLSKGAKKHAFSPHHAARPQPRCRDEVLSGR